MQGHARSCVSFELAHCFYTVLNLCFFQFNKHVCLYMLRELLFGSAKSLVISQGLPLVNRYLDEFRRLTGRTIAVHLPMWTRRTDAPN